MTDLDALRDEVAHALNKVMSSWPLLNYHDGPAMDRVADAILPVVRRREEALGEVAALHTPWGIYGECGHDNHTETEGLVDTGYALVCAEGKLYDVCRECHMDGGEAEYEPEWVADSDDARWPCPTFRAISSVAESLSSCRSGRDTEKAEYAAMENRIRALAAQWDAQAALIESKNRHNVLRVTLRMSFARELRALLVKS